MRYSVFLNARNDQMGIPKAKANPIKKKINGNITNSSGVLVDAIGRMKNNREKAIKNNPNKKGKRL
jgi:hypothetical protein